MTDQYYQEDSQATTVLVLGILSLVFTFVCGFGIILGPIAWIMGNKELASIDSGLRAPQNRGSAQAGRIMGIIATVLGIISIVALIIFVIVLAASGTS